VATDPTTEHSWCWQSRAGCGCARGHRCYISLVDLASFEASVTQTAPPHGLSDALQALWHERRGDWNRAHQIAQEIAGPDGAWVHAYLHRREGDPSNATYWYQHAGKPIARGPLDEEWAAIVEALLTA
jgi:hypothetical protein